MRGCCGLKALMAVIFVSAVAVAFGAEALAQGLTVTVTTDKEVYQPGELITIQVRVTRDGQPVPARIYDAYIDITYADGWTVRRYIAWQLQPVGLGLFVVQGYAGRTGVREVHVTVYLQETCCYGGWPVQCWCCCVLWGSGTATYQVVSPPPPCCPPPCCPPPPPTCGCAVTGPLCAHIFGGNKHVCRNQEAEFSALGSTGPIVEYRWDFGDGATETGFKVYHAYSRPGTYTVTLTVIDAEGNTATDSIKVFVHYRCIEEDC